jgi:hypothetical protein
MQTSCRYGWGLSFFDNSLLNLRQFRVRRITCPYVGSPFVSLVKRRCGTIRHALPHSQPLLPPSPLFFITLQQPKKGWPQATSRDYLVPFTLTSFAVSLLLVFRTNSSYSRWWEARMQVGGLVNRCRSVARMVRRFFLYTHSHTRARLLFRGLLFCGNE